MSGSIGVIGWGDGNHPSPLPGGECGGMGGKYLVMVEDGTFFYTELNGFDIIHLSFHFPDQNSDVQSPIRAFHQS